VPGLPEGLGKKIILQTSEAAIKKLDPKKERFQSSKAAPGESGTGYKTAISKTENRKADSEAYQIEKAPFQFNIVMTNYLFRFYNLNVTHESV
jgi:hypothetical protein